MIMKNETWKTAADNFVDNEQEFHLGFLVTESSHPYTKTLDKTIRENTADGIRQLLKVDTDIEKAFPGFIEKKETEALKEAVISSVIYGKRIIFSGCGSTGRLAVLLESLWRKGCREIAEQVKSSGSGAEKVSELLEKSASGVRGIITGGDRALIRSVENFEDFQEFGRQQTRELNLENGDVFIAVSEGGETSSVIGSAHEAFERGCTTFFVFNNPKDILTDRIERSRNLIHRPGIIPVDLTTGPMAVSGSTRMQATTMELLYLGSVLETSITHILKENGYSSIKYGSGSLPEYPVVFGKLLESFNLEKNINSIAGIIELQERVYSEKGTVLYSADEFLLDIFTDTTEQTPTFSLPPFRSIRSKDSPAPWAAALHPLENTERTWEKMLGRKPEGLSWDESMYRKLGTPGIAENPPELDRKEIYSYSIGKEGFKLYEKETSVLINIFFPDFYERIYPHPSDIKHIESVYDLEITDSGEPSGTQQENLLKISLFIPDSPLHLFPHVAAKILFNTVSTGTMARMGRIKGNWMIEVTPSNKKLIDRSIRIISDLKSVPYREAAYMIFREIEKNPEDLSSLVARLL